MPVCQECREFLTPDFGRVFGDENDDVYACFACQPRTAIRGAAANLCEEQL